MNSKDNKECSRCVLDTTVSDIHFDENGVCNYCHSYEEIIKTIPTDKNAEIVLSSIVNNIKRDGQKKEYDCIIGLSGGVDSTYLAYLVVSLGLRPLAVHVDTGWNSEIAVQNIENVINKLNLDLFTFVVNWEEMKDLQLSFFKASVPDCDIPQDHVFPAVLHKIAKEKKIKHIISGHNIVTEYIIPTNWSYDSNDLIHIEDIQNRFGSIKLRDYPRYGYFTKAIYRFIHKIQSHRFLYYIPYNKEEIKEFISENLDWKDYGGKHFESRFTRFFQSYYLPTKFGFDKRKAHLSNLILSGQITKEDALSQLKEPLYDNHMLIEDIDYILRKLSITENQWLEIMKLPLKKHSDYKLGTESLFFKIYKLILKIKGKK